KIHEHCPIYYKKGGVIESCDTRDMVPTGNTKVHWAECTINNPSKRKFFFGCAHFSYAIASAEVTLIGEDIKTRVEGAAASGQKFEFILGMDANSFHTADARQKGGWDTFKALVPNATFPTFPPNSFTKVSKRNDIQNKPHYGPPNNRSNQIYDWLVFNVKDALDYVSPSLRVPPVSTQLKVPAGGNRDKKFNEAWFESFSDHLPVDALFTIKP
ncbi:MAG TPA: hypothetical protein VHO25_09435, partial [Polyangiaceae bacterium]|nr:hypothetical protein [Polyangiaceae bacterium]